MYCRNNDVPSQLSQVHDAYCTPILSRQTLHFTFYCELTRSNLAPFVVILLLQCGMIYIQQKSGTTIYLQDIRRFSFFFVEKTPNEVPPVICLNINWHWFVLYKLMRVDNFRLWFTYSTLSIHLCPTPVFRHLAKTIYPIARHGISPIGLGPRPSKT